MLLVSCNGNRQTTNISQFSLVQIGISSLPGFDEKGEGYKITHIPKECVIINNNDGKPSFLLRKDVDEIVPINTNETDFLNTIIREIFNNLVPMDNKRFVTRGQFAPKLVEFGFIVNNVTNNNLNDFFRQQKVLIGKPKNSSRLLLYHSSLGDQDVTLGPSCIFLSDQSYPDVSKLSDGSFVYFDSNGVFQVWELTGSGYRLWDQRMYDVNSYEPDMSKI
jgi:hypothetical protein